MGFMAGACAGRPSRGRTVQLCRSEDADGGIDVSSRAGRLPTPPIDLGSKQQDHSSTSETGRWRRGMFITIEDETSVGNLVIWPKIFERYRRIILGAGMIAIHGRIPARRRGRSSRRL